MVVRRTKISDILEGNHGGLERCDCGEGGKFFEQGDSIFVCRKVAILGEDGVF